MANNDNPHGLRAVKMLNGGKIPTSEYIVGTTTVVYEGDIVNLRAAGKVATLKTTGGAANTLGVAVHYATTGQALAVYDDPGTVFEVQSDGATDPGATTAQGHIGNNAPLVVTTGNTTSKISKHELDYSAVTTGTADPLKIIGIYAGADNDSTLAHARYLVLLNKHIMGPHGARTVI